MKGALDVHRQLLAAGVAHEMVRLGSALLDADDLPRVLGVPAASCARIRCYRILDPAERAGLAAILVRTGRIPEPTRIREGLTAAAVRPATAAEINEGTDFAASLVSPVCLPPTVELLADAALSDTEVLYVPTGESGVALGIRTVDLLVATRARAMSLTTRPLAAAERSGWHPGLPGQPARDLLPSHRRIG